MRAFIFAVCLVLVSSVSHADVASGSTIKIAGSDGTVVGVDTNGQLHTVMMGKIDSNNSSTTPLTGGAGFVGSATDASGYSTIAVTVSANVTSAYRGLKIQFSPDLLHWHDGEEYTIPADADKFYSVPVWSRYYRMLYTNGAAAQTSFDLEAFLRKSATKYSSHNIIDDLNDEDDAELTVTVNKAKNPSGNYVNIGATASGNLKVASVEDGLNIALGKVQGQSVLHKFGAAPDFDQGDGEVTIWDAAEDDTNWENMRYNWGTTANIRGISSTDNSDVQEVVIQGVDAATNFLSQTVTLSGTNIVLFPTNFYAVFRGYNDNSTVFAGHVLVYTNNTAENITAGYPDDAEGVRLAIQPGNQQTEMAVYVVPMGKTLAIRRLYAYTAGASRDSEYVIHLYSRLPQKVFRLKFNGAMSDAAGPLGQPYPDPLVFTEGTAIEMTVKIPSGTATAAAISGGFSGVLVDN